MKSKKSKPSVAPWPVFPEETERCLHVPVSSNDAETALAEAELAFEFSESWQALRRELERDVPEWFEPRAEERDWLRWN